MNDPELLERLRPGYELLSERRYDEWAQLLDPEVECRQDPRMVGTAVDFRGREGAKAMMAELEEAWEWISWEPVEAHDLGDGRYLVRVSTSGVGLESGVPLEGTEIGHLLTVRDGMTTTIDVFMDWGAALRAAGRARDDRAAGT